MMEEKMEGEMRKQENQGSVKIDLSVFKNLDEMRGVVQNEYIIFVKIWQWW